MTLKEADEIARKKLPVVNNDIEYLRICEIGYSYDDKGRPTPFVVLFDKCGHSVTRADPARCKVKEAET